MSGLISTVGLWSADKAIALTGYTPVSMFQVRSEHRGKTSGVCPPCVPQGVHIKIGYSSADARREEGPLRIAQVLKIGRQSEHRTVLDHRLQHGQRASMAYPRHSGWPSDFCRAELDAKRSGDSLVGPRGKAGCQAIATSSKSGGGERLRGLARFAPSAMPRCDSSRGQQKKWRF